MLTSFCSVDSKDLYFKLNNSLLMSDPFVISQTMKVAGLYAIYKNNLCLYVGQSKNLASRIATHLTGKYKSCNRVDVFYICEMYEDFYTREAKTQKEILEHNEMFLINTLNPTENIIVDRELVSIGDDIFCRLIDGPRPPYADAFISVSDNSICVTDDPFHCIYDLHQSIHDAYKDLIDNTKMVAK